MGAPDGWHGAMTEYRMLMGLELFIAMVIAAGYPLLAAPKIARGSLLHIAIWLAAVTLSFIPLYVTAVRNREEKHGIRRCFDFHLEEGLAALSRMLEAEGTHYSLDRIASRFHYGGYCHLFCIPLTGGDLFLKIYSDKYSRRHVALYPIREGTAATAIDLAWRMNGLFR
ncbi:MAG: hypothetical protein JXA20_08015 [Spirochaetes bacterium]|nr:hypothetical protein [Spirochaetota bacterium]